MSIPALTEDEVREGLDNLIAEIDTARLLIQRGTMLELAGMDERVTTVCEAAKSLPEAQAARMVDRMETLVAQLEELAAALVRSQPATAAPAEGGVHRRAVDAYSKGSAEKE